MSHRELIIRLLERVERRTRANRYLTDVAKALSISLLFPIAFKLLDLLWPFRGTTVTVVFTVWAVATVVWIGWLLRGRDNLAEVASKLDKQADLHDQIRTAYWFIRNPRPSPWVDVQIHRAAENAGRINIEALYPRRIPNTSYTAAGLLLILVVLNFLPLPWNHNWLYLEAAPAFSLSADEQALMDQTRTLLQEAEKLEQSQLAAEIEKIIEDLQEGNISLEEAMRQLEELQQALGEGNLDLGNINHGLAEMASDLAQSESQGLKSVGEQMAQGNLTQASDQLKDLADQLSEVSEEERQQIEKTLKEASENARPGLEDLSADVKASAEALEREDIAGAEEALSQAGQDLKTLSDKIKSQGLKNKASEQLEAMQDAFMERQQEMQAEGFDGESERAESSEPRQVGQVKSSGPPQDAVAAGPPLESKPVGNTAGDQGTESPIQSSDEGDPEGNGLLPSGDSSGGPLEGVPTQLDVQLEKEQLEGESSGGERQEDIEEASRQERSKLDYRNVPSELSPAQKDSLNQDKIPWEYRDLIKKYFQAIRPQEQQ